MLYKCITSCFFRVRLWHPGETLVAAPGEVIPKWFKLVKSEASSVKEVEEPKTFSEINKKQDKEEKKMLKAKTKKSDDFLS